jgi:hypothetical protein
MNHHEPYPETACQNCGSWYTDRCCPACIDHPLPYLPPEAFFHTSLDPLESKAHLLPLGRLHTRAPAPTGTAKWRHSGWRDTRDLIYQSLQRTHQTINRINRFADCGAHYYVYESTINPDTYIVSGNACRDRFCLPCAVARSHLIARRTAAKIGDTPCRLLTLTYNAGSAPLDDCLTGLYHAFACLRRSTLWRDRVTGGAAFCEATYNPSRPRWNVHLHVIIQGRYLPHDQLRRLWLAITGHSYVLDIRFCRDRTAAARYAAKYASKPFNNTYIRDHPRLDEAILAFAGRRLALTFGTWRGYRLTSPEASSEWEFRGSLLSWLTAAGAGDALARRVVGRLPDAIVEAALSDTRAPPTHPTAGPKVPDAQMTFFAVTPWPRF